MAPEACPKECPAGESRDSTGVAKQVCRCPPKENLPPAFFQDLPLEAPAQEDPLALPMPAAAAPIDNGPAGIAAAAPGSGGELPEMFVDEDDEDEEEEEEGEDGEAYGGFFGGGEDEDDDLGESFLAVVVGRGLFVRYLLTFT